MYNKNLNRWKLKKWYDVVVPDYLNAKNPVLGSIISHDESNLVNRTIRVSLADITQKMDEKSLYSTIIFRTVAVRGTQIQSEVVGFEIALSYLKNLARSRKTVIHHFQRIKLKDGREVAVKTFLVTSDSVSATVKRNLRKKLETEIINELRTKTFSEFVNSLIDDSLINRIYKELNRVNPIDHFLIKKFEI